MHAAWHRGVRLGAAIDQSARLETMRAAAASRFIYLILIGESFADQARTGSRTLVAPCIIDRYR